MSPLNNTIYLKDYSPTPYQIHTSDLSFYLMEGEARVENRMQISRREGIASHAALELDGEELSLLAIRLNGQTLVESDYQLSEKKLILQNLPASFSLEIETRIHPELNTALSGLYKSSGNFCTQCEAEGFRRITYYYDRPDVMAIFSTRIIADPTRYPVLLSNGNLVDKGTLDTGEHWALWQDPFPKPCYLFALVAGNLAQISDTFITQSGREVALYIYTEHHNIDQCDHAMRSLKEAMRWDEDVYGREYDLDIYMIVAVDDFNMGAMENKGLNVFNSKYVLAKPETATDDDYQGIESVVAHEYFHNWSGNRVTCRDWFQLSLKEGFTVFRDQEFSADMQSRGVKCIEDANILRSFQFREDSGPMAHPVRPESYVEINNFYTLTVYEKGATLIRMLQLLLGAETFRQGTDLYFSRFDGQAVTTDDFVAVMSEVSGLDLSQFKLWYSQAGTPQVTVQQHYDVAKQELTLQLKQTLAATPGQSEKRPMLIPLAIGLLDSQGKELPLHLNDAKANASTHVLQLTKPEQSFVLQQVPPNSTPSLLRGFSAPVKLQSDLSETQQYFLMANDPDDFVRWDAGQQLAIKQILQFTKAIQQGESCVLDIRFIDALAQQLSQWQSHDQAMLALALTLPSETYLASFMQPIEPVVLHQARQAVKQQIARALQQPLFSTYQALSQPTPFSISAAAMARRQLKNVCLSYLMETAEPQVIQLCEQQFYGGDNMTDVLASLSALVNSTPLLGQSALESFYDKWNQESLVVDKWLTLQAHCRLSGTLERVKQLTEHSAFKLNNPNKVRALIGAFCSGNAAQFHDISGNGYQFLAEYIVKLNAINPQIAARLVTPLLAWRQYNPQRQQLMQQQLLHIAAQANLSADVYEVVGKALQQVDVSA